MSILRFFIGDENGFLKSITCSTTANQTDEPSVKIIREARGSRKGVSRLSYNRTEDGLLMLLDAGADGAASLYSIKEDSAETINQWKDPRMKAQDSFIGAALSASGAYTCSSSGHLRLTHINPTSSSTFHKAIVPMRLCDWQLSPDEKTFAYGGDEVDLSIWDIERTFSQGDKSSSSSQGTSSATGQKRKKPSANDLLPSEIWRAKNLPNDNLSLRQPVHISSLAYLSAQSASSSHHIVTGSRLGNVRRYDTRTARRPIANWTQFKSVRKVQQGCAEHEVFVADVNSGLYSVDTRNGRILCGYKGISGAVNDIATAPGHVATTSFDRFLRLHPAYDPPSTPGTQVQAQRKGETIVKQYLKSTPTAIVWDGQVLPSVRNGDDGDDGVRDGDDDEVEGVWDEMDVVEEASEDEDSDKKRNSKKSRRQNI